MVRTADGDAPPDSDTLPPGAKAGPWIVECELGRGGMGAVYGVVHEEIGKRAALKVVHQVLVANGFNAERMLVEAKVVNLIDHPNVVDIFEIGRLPDRRPYIVMERLEGQSLAESARQAQIPRAEVVDILLQVADALIAAHAAGIVHRDLKLDNVFLVRNPDGPGAPHVKVVDWGIAKDLTHDVRHTIEGTLVGTPEYLSPEQARGKPVSPRTDVYSLGVMAYELFLGKLPFTAETAAEIMVMHLHSKPPRPKDLWPDIPPALEWLLYAMLDKTPEHRPSMPVVVRTLEGVRESVRTSRPSGPRLAAAVPPSESGVELPRRRRWRGALGVVSVMAMPLMFVVARASDDSAIVQDRPAIAVPVPAAPAPPLPPTPIPQPVAPPRVEVAPPAIVTIELPRAATNPRRARAVERTFTPVLPTATSPTPDTIANGPPLDPDGTLEPYR